MWSGFSATLKATQAQTWSAIRCCYTTCKLKAEPSATQKKPCPEQWKAGLLENSGWGGGEMASKVPRLKPWYKRKRAAVAQMDRARASEARGREFESPQPHHSSH